MGSVRGPLASGRGNHWFPLRDRHPTFDVMPFHEEFFEKMKVNDIPREVLASRGIVRVLQFHEFGPPDYEIELAIFEPQSADGGKQYSTSESMDWFVYASHESAITIAGDWLTDFFRNRWPDCGARTYQGPYSTVDLRGRQT